MEKEKLQNHIRLLKESIEFQETLRPTLGDRMVDEVKLALRRQIISLEKTLRPADPSLDALLQPMERKQVTVMFADISGYTSMSEKLDPEKVRSTITVCFERLVRWIHYYGGTVEKYIGDAVMAVFGAPLAYEDAPHRACRAGLAMMVELESINRDLDHALGMHIGINTGLVICGEMGVRGQYQYVVTGDTVNLASRLEDKSERGQIFVGPNTYKLTREAFQYEYKGPIPMKGKARPVEVYQLLSATTVQESKHFSSQDGFPMVGREEECDQIIECANALKSKKGAIIFIIGEAGIGKTRLIGEIKKSVQDRRLLWLEGSTLSYTQSISYWMFLEIFRNYFDILDTDGEELAFNKVRSALSELYGEDNGEALPFIATFLGLSLPEELQKNMHFLDSEAMKGQIFRAIRDFFRRLSSRSPLILAIEDLHWADNSSLELFKHLFPLTGEHPILIIALTRPHTRDSVEHLRESASREFPGWYVEFRLSPLSKEESLKFMENIQEMKDADLARWISERAAGNPLYLEEIARTIIDRAGADSEKGIQDFKNLVPDSLQGLVMSRVDRLDEKVRSVLRSASVIGHSFHYPLLSGVAGFPEEIESITGELERQQFFLRKSEEPEREYAFRHALVQEIVYESMSQRDRQDLHKRVAQLIESVSGERISGCYGILAYHYAQALEWEKAQHYLLAIGDQAERIAADSEALSHFQRAMEAYNRAFGEQWEPLKRAAIERKIGKALVRRGDIMGARDHLINARNLLGLKIHVSRWEMQKATLLPLLLHIYLQLFPCKSPPRVSDEEELGYDEFFRVNEDLGWVEYVVDQERYFFYTLEYINLAERLCRKSETATGLAGLAIVFDVGGLFGIAERYLGKALKAAGCSGSPLSLCYVYMGLGLHYFICGNLKDSAEYLTLAEAIARETKDQHLWAGIAVEYATLLYAKGKLDGCLRFSQEMTQVGRDAKDEQVTGWGLMGEGHIKIMKGLTDEAGIDLSSALAILRRIPDYYYIPKVYAHLIEYHMRKGEYLKALEISEDADHLAARQKIYSHYMGWLRNAQCRLYIELFNREDNESVKKAHLTNAGKACRLALLAANTSAGCLSAAIKLKGSYEWARGNRSGARGCWERALKVAAKREEVSSQAFILYEIARKTGEKAPLEKASSLFSKIGIIWDVGNSGKVKQWNW